jgi:uncharacterized protein (DUF58 family)
MGPVGILVLAVLAALLCGLFLHPQGFVLAGGVLTVVVLGFVWPWLSLRGLAGSVAFDRLRASEGDRIEVCLTLRNRLPWAAWGLAVRGGFLPCWQGTAAGALVASIASAPGRRKACCRWAFVPACRGVYPTAVPRLTSGFPFGLWEARRNLAVETPLLVWPRTLPVGPVPPVSGDQQIEGNVSRSKVGSNGDELGVRPYRRGDSPRRIHWGQSARHDRLIVCELQSNARPVIQLVFDADARSHAGGGLDGSREWAIRIVASLARGWLESGAQVGLAWGGQEIPPASGRPQLHKILDALAALPDPAGKPLAELLACPTCRGFRDGLQVIITTDTALTRSAFPASVSDEQRWVVLRAGAFAGASADAAAGPASLSLRPWLWIDAVEHIPGLLRGGWREAHHGS